MTELTINNTYQIIDTLFTNDTQSIYLVEDKTKQHSDALVMNVFKDADTVYRLKKSFSDRNQTGLKNLVECFEKDVYYYIVGKVCTGATLETFLSGNLLRLADKMYIVESFLSQLSPLSHMDPSLLYGLCNPDCLSVAGKRNICFNLNFHIDNTSGEIQTSDAIKRVGSVLTAIFKNTVHQEFYEEKDNLPPAIAAIIAKCSSAKYGSIGAIYEDFKSSLLFATFIESASIDHQLAKNLNKVKRKKTLGFLVRPIILLLVLLLAGSGIWGLAQSLLHRSGKSGPAFGMIQTNTKPLAKFSVSSSKIYQGDEILFTNESTDPDLLDKIKQNKWQIYKDNVFIVDSLDENMKCIFSAEGNYVVTLTVTDSKGNVSDAYKMNLTVLAKQVIPSTTPVSTEGDSK